ncbi:hypothetical protein IT407_01310 [Candidatus Uhrbacteria bacterium]|nr:hypothetical protein [Candidatus Uhrbacteria bacterium]
MTSKPNAAENHSRKISGLSSSGIRPAWLAPEPDPDELKRVGEACEEDPSFT